MKRLALIIFATIAAAGASFGGYEAGMALRPATVEYVTPDGQPTHP